MRGRWNGGRNHDVIAEIRDGVDRLEEAHQLVNVASDHEYSSSGGNDRVLSVPRLRFAADVQVESPVLPCSAGAILVCSEERLGDFTRKIQRLLPGPI